VRVATWNVNSLRVREGQLSDWLALHRPDVVCLQETKTEDHAFPTLMMLAAGYHAVPYGEKGHNGVALLVRGTPTEVDVGLDDGQARVVTARVGGVRVVGVYAPTGGDGTGRAFDFKIDWYARLTAWLAARATPDEPLLLCGDFNITPAGVDLTSPDRYRRSAMCLAPARAAFQGLLDWGLVDTFRLVHPHDPGCTWWAWRAGGGLDEESGARIDMVLASAPLADRLLHVEVDHEALEVTRPSDHAPLVAVFRS